MTSQTPPKSRLSRGIDALFFRLLPLLLLLSMAWMIFQIITALSNQAQGLQLIESRQDAYAATATTLAENDLPASNDHKPQDPGIRLIAQFATNTPDAPEAEAPLHATIVPTPEPATAPQERTPIALPTFFRPSEASIPEISGTQVPTQVPLIPRDYELINILLLGGDDELTDDNTVRTDTMIIVSVNTETGSVAMLSLPRDLFVYVPTPTMTRLNTVYSIGESFGWSGGGFGLLRETIFYNFGVQVHYYAKVSFSGFQEIIDTIGGVELAVDCDYQDYYPIAPIEELDLTRPIEENYQLRTLPIGYYEMDGFDALWFARIRRNTEDFDRGRRQQRLLRAIFRAARDSGQIATLPTLWGQLTEIIETDIPFDLVLGLLPIASSLDLNDVENFTMIRTYHTIPWQPPSGALAGQAVQLPSYEPLRQLLTDFYQPPTSSRIALRERSVAVFNNSSTTDLDRVATEILREQGIAAYAAGSYADNSITQTTIVDLSGEEKGSIVADLSSGLNLRGNNTLLQPDAARAADYHVILGDDYDPCTANVLALDGS